VKARRIVGARRREPGLGAIERLRDVSLPRHAALAVDRQAREHVLELAHVARPGVRGEARQRLR
jgi:hypothetical protein